jgi:circadian clock protein KaiC
MQEQDTMHRGLMILKMRGSEHAKEIRRFTIDNTGMHLGEAFKDAPNVFTGSGDVEYRR